MKNMTLDSLVKRKGKSKVRICAADCESWGKRSAHFRCGSIAYYYHNKLKVDFFTNVNEFFLRMSQFEVTYFYNLGYDSQYLANFAFESGEWTEFRIESGSRLLGLKFSRDMYEQSFIVKDIFPFAEGGLGDSCKEYKIEERKFAVDFDNSSDLDIRKHNEIDSIMCLKLTLAIRESWWENFGIDICAKKCYSLPSAAMKVYRTNFIKSPIENPFFLVKWNNGRPEVVIRHELEAFVRQAYKGGFCNAEDMEIHENVKSYDVVSEYPFAITALRFPTGRAKWIDDYYEWIEYVKYIPGIANIQMYFDKPLLCGIREDKLVKLCGIFTETLTSIEILYALSKGARILKFNRGVVFSDFDRHNSLARFERKCIRLKATSKGGRKISAKKAANSTYGKTGQKYFQEKTQFIYIRGEDELQEYLSQAEGVVEYYEYENGGIILEAEYNISPKPFMNVCWAALITAFGRIYLLDNAEKVNSIYEDTDNCKTELDVLPIDFPVLKKVDKAHKWLALGFFEKEAVYELFRALAPKLYCCRLGTLEFEGNVEKEQYVVKCKGVPKEQRDKKIYDILLGLETIQTEQYVKQMSCREGLRAVNYLDKEGIFGGVRLTQKILNPTNKQIWRLG